jgi:hypothetical protein
MRAKEFIFEAPPAQQAATPKPAPAQTPAKGVSGYGQQVQNTLKQTGQNIKTAQADPATRARDAQIQQQRAADPNFQKGVATVTTNQPVRKDVDNSQPRDATTTVTGSGYRGGGGYSQGERTAQTAIATGQDTTGTDMRTNMDRAYDDGMGKFTTRGGTIAPTGKDNFKDANYIHKQDPATGKVTKHALTSAEKAGQQALDSIAQGAGETDLLGDLSDGGAALKQAVGMDPNDAVSAKNVGKIANTAYNKVAGQFDQDQAAKFQQQAQAQAAARAQQQTKQT